LFLQAEAQFKTKGVTQSSNLIFLQNQVILSKVLVATGASASVFPHGPGSPSVPGVVIQLRTADGTSLDTNGSCCLALQFGSRMFEWDFLLAKVSMPILGSDFLHHYHHNSISNRFLFTGCFNIRTNSCHFLDPLPCYQPQRSSLILLLSILMLCHPRGLVLPFQNTQLDIMFPLFLVHQFWQRSWNQQGRNLPLIEAAGVIRHFSSP